jgi:hypothetical protein
MMANKQESQHLQTDYSNRKFINLENSQTKIITIIVLNVIVITVAILKF